MIKLHTNHGVITLKLDEEKAPETAANFKEYVKSGHYDNTVFHRVINNFMIQGGGFEPGMKQKPTRAPIKNEANNGLTNKVGSIAMARTMDPHSASAQFFINVADNDFLNHTAPHHPGLGLCRLRRSGRGHGRGQQDQGRGHHHAQRPPGRAGRGRDHREGRNRRRMKR
ncbi:peptidyl-prolyl cis-trans isomerase B [Pseudomonas fluorescens]|uniref:Peptidyl-prolyl cis-trans isomerase n=1 Tax=Pseudomonas fluorescens TaxID=294 RepID=A0A3S4MQK3_PSEFL|nr:peptidyl-prolyl cis-trans isomerase B [Pseudomonas fluorescens]